MKKKHITQTRERIMYGFHFFFSVEIERKKNYNNR